MMMLNILALFAQNFSSPLRNWANSTRHRSSTIQSQFRLIYLSQQLFMVHDDKEDFVWQRQKYSRLRSSLPYQNFDFLLLYWSGIFLQIRHNMMRIVRKQTTYLQKHNNQVCPIYSGPFLWLVVVLNLLKARGHTWNLVRSP